MDATRRFSLRGSSMPESKTAAGTGGPRFLEGDIVLVMVGGNKAAFIVESYSQEPDGTFMYGCLRDGERRWFDERRLKLSHREGQHRAGDLVMYRGYHVKVCRVSLDHDGALIYDVTNKNKDGSVTNTVNVPHYALSEVG